MAQVVDAEGKVVRELTLTDVLLHLNHFAQRVAKLSWDLVGDDTECPVCHKPGITQEQFEAWMDTTDGG